MYLTATQERRLRALESIGPFVDPRPGSISANPFFAAGYAACVNDMLDILDLRKKGLSPQQKAELNVIMMADPSEPFVPGAVGRLKVKAPPPVKRGRKGERS